MNPIEWFQDLESARKKRVEVLVSVLAVLLLAMMIVGIARCERSTAMASARVPEREEAAIAQVREAMLEVMTLLNGDGAAPTVEDAVGRAAANKRGAVHGSTVDKSPLRFNPNPRHWKGGKGGPPSGTPLVVGAAPASYKSRKVLLIGVGRGGVPIEIVAGSEPEWLPTAVVGPKD